MLRSNLNNQVLDIDSSSILPGTTILLYKEHGGLNQKWKIIPAAAWEDYETLMSNPTPLTRATFWKIVVTKHFNVVIGSDAKEFKQKIANSHDLLKNSAEQLEKVNTDTGTILVTFRYQSTSSIMWQLYRIKSIKFQTEIIALIFIFLERR